MEIVFLFRPYQLHGVKRKCALVAFFLFCLDALYRLAFQIFQISHSKLSRLQTLPRYFLNQCNLAALFDCKSLSSALKRTAAAFIFENDNAELFLFCPWYSHNDFYLSLV